ncbi:MAG: rhomboid family intramembrane serine protease [archaeon]|nr:rhomboid family intramembrane serine protease [archaeon]
MENKFKFYAIKLSIICLIIFILQNILSGFTDLFILNSQTYWEIWRFLTAIFLHGSLIHLVYNLFALLLFGSIVERFIGGKRFLIVFFASGILANIISAIFYPSSLGASGAIFGVIGTLVFIRPTMAVFAFGLPMPMFLAGILWMAGDLLGAYGFLVGNPIDNTGNIAHLTGMLVGLIFGIFFRNWKRDEKRYRIELDENSVRKWEDNYLR